MTRTGEVIRRPEYSLDQGDLSALGSDVREFGDERARTTAHDDDRAAEVGSRIGKWIARIISDVRIRRGRVNRQAPVDLQRQERVIRDGRMAVRQRNSLNEGIGVLDGGNRDDVRA